MKKLMVLAAVAVFGLSRVNAQGDFRAGLTAGIPVGDFSDAYTFNVGLDINYLWEVSEDFDAGIASGFNQSFGDDQDFTFFGETVTLEVEDFQYIPLAAAGRFNASEDFQVGADLGYAIAVGEGDGGFYYRPMVGYSVGETTQITLSYRRVSADGGSFSTVNAGVNFGF
jgi:hypothetical protein